MTAVFKLTDGTDTIDLTSSTDFQHVESDALESDYLPKIASIPGDGSIPDYPVEVIPCRINTSGEDNLAASLQKFHRLQNRAAEHWRDKTQETPVWYHQKLDAETGERRALVKRLEIDLDQNYFRTAPRLTAGLYCRLTVTRHPYWEKTSTTETSSDSSNTGAAVMLDPSSTDITGDVGGRYSKLSLSWPAADLLDRFWIGCRSVNKHGATALSGFEEILEFSATGTDSSNGADATASGGSRVTVTPGTETLLERATATFNGTGANNKGEFIWLVRAAVTSGTWNIQGRLGYSGMADGDLSQTDYKTITNTSWDFYDIGVASIPLQGGQFEDMGSFGVSSFVFKIWAERTAGSGSLWLDCVCPVPVDEGFLWVKGAAVGYDNLVFETTPKDEMRAIVLDGSTIEGNCAFSAERFYLPPGDIRLVTVFARASSSDITDALTLDTGLYYPRWVSLRGSE